jgi:hypothetical protein
MTPEVSDLLKKALALPPEARAASRPCCQMPANKPYRFHPQAWQEAEAAEPGIGNGVMRASTRFLSEIYDALENLAQWHQRWPFYQHGTRRFVLHRFPFSVIYRDEPAVVSIGEETWGQTGRTLISWLTR